MADWLPEEHLVWFVLDVVAQLDTAAFHATRKTGGVGRQGYDPDMLLALMIYAYSVGERSSRRIERLCVDHVAFRILCGQDVPDHTTIARFRSTYHDAFADLFAQVLRLCADAGMVKVGVISIDGTKIAANGSMSANRSHEWLADRLLIKPTGGPGRHRRTQKTSPRHGTHQCGQIFTESFPFTGTDPGGGPDRNRHATHLQILTCKASMNTAA